MAYEPKPTGRWIAEEIFEGPLISSEEEYGAYQGCASETIAREIATLAAAEGWRVDVYPELTATSLIDGNFPTQTDAQAGFRLLWGWDEKFG